MKYGVISAATAAVTGLILTGFPTVTAPIAVASTLVAGGVVGTVAVAGYGFNKIRNVFSKRKRTHDESEKGALQNEVVPLTLVLSDEPVGTELECSQDNLPQINTTESEIVQEILPQEILPQEIVLQEIVPQKIVPTVEPAQEEVRIEDAPTSLETETTQSETEDEQSDADNDRQEDNLSEPESKRRKSSHSY